MIRSLTSLRFVFALMVFLSHTAFVTQENSWFNSYRIWFKQGFIGVNFFFMLSGFILSYNYYNKFTSLQFPDIKRFYIKRFLKIYPSFWVSLLLSLYFAGELWANNNYKEILSLNILLLQAWVPGKWYQWFLNPPAWSLSVEVFFYFLFPFIIYAISKVKKNRGIIFILAFIIVQCIITALLGQSLLDKFWFYLFPASNLILFLTGIGLFLVYKNYNSYWLKKSGTGTEVLALLFLIICIACHQQVPENFLFILYYLPCAAIIIFVFSFEQGILSGFLNNSVLVYLGNISFQFYLLHFLAIWFWCKIDYLYIQGLQQNVIVLLSFITTLGGSMITYHFIELPAQRIIRK